MIVKNRLHDSDCIFGSHEHAKFIFGMLLICMDGPLASSWMIDAIQSYSLLKSLYFIGRCPVIMNILAIKIRAFQTSLKEQNGDFLENARNNLLINCICF
jgi:hypothetical protein